jgi:hypothetical protein
MNTRTPLFDVVISVYGDENTGSGIYDVFVIDKYHGGPGDTPWVVGHQSNLTSLDQSIQFAKGAVTAFMEGTGFKKGFEK